MYTVVDPTEISGSGLWGVWCCVWGGCTGHREAWLKSDGKVVVFQTEEAAQTKAAELAWPRGSLAAAQFRYFARQF